MRIVEIAFGHIEENVIYRSAFGEHESLELAKINEGVAEEIVERFVANFNKLESKLLDIESKINSENNKGSFLSSMLNIKEEIPKHAGLGDYSSLLEKIEGLESLLSDYVKKNRQKNTDIKQALLLELDVLLENNDLEEVYELIKDLQKRWIKTGTPDLEIKDELENKFKKGMNVFFEKRNAFSDDKKMLAQARVGEYQSIIDSIQEIVTAGKFSHTFDQVVGLQKQWKEIGRLPESEYKALNEVYWATCKVYFDGQRSQRNQDRKSKSKDAKASLKERQKVIEALSTLVENGFEATDLDFEKIKTEWKNSGNLSKKSNPEIHERFLNLSREFQERQFVKQLASRKNKGFAKKDAKDQLKDLIRVIRDLLSRDESELNLFKENMESMHINKGSFVDMLEAKLKGFEEKVKLKRALLQECNEKMKQL